ncbi:hypothetical protein C8R43DRAFT_1131257 [Mycena crocata]|nr:hypothetical protein C8R43DRAFT_1131257 [Mycena crocata]
MTRSELSPHSPRVVRKAFRAQANSTGLSFRAAILATKVREEEEGKKIQKPVGIIRRNPGRMDGVQWNGDSFVCARQVDGDKVHDEHVAWDAEEQEDSVQVEEVEDRRPQTHIVVSLLDIARPAKRRGAAKKSQSVPTLRRMIEFDDDTVSEQWEQWEAESDAWDMQSEQWESQSEQWEIPAGDHSAEEWEELYQERFEKESRSYSAAVRGNR